MTDDEQMMSGEEFAQRNRATSPGEAHPNGRGAGPRPPQQPASAQQSAQQSGQQPHQQGGQQQPPWGQQPPPQPSRPPQQGYPSPQPPQQGSQQGRPTQHPQGQPPQGQPQHGQHPHGHPAQAPSQAQHRAAPAPSGWDPAPAPAQRVRPDPTPPPVPEPRGPVTADDFLHGRQRETPDGPASWGWRGFLRRITFGLVAPAMGPAEKAHHRDRRTVQRTFDGPKTIVFVNPKGGAAKTTSVLMSGYTFGTVRGGGVVAWDNNETRGTLGVRGLHAKHNNTARELLAARERFSDVYSARLGDLGGYVRSQGEAHFDLLASDEQPGVTGTIHADDFRNLHHLLNRFYRMVLVDTGNNIRAENWLAAVDSADLLVVTTTVREDTGYSGLWMLDALAAEGRGDLVERSVTILSDPASKVDDELASALTQAYETRSRSVVRVPFDPVLVSGSVVDYGRLSRGTREAWLRACAEMAEAL